MTRLFPAPVAATIKALLLVRSDAAQEFTASVWYGRSLIIACFYLPDLRDLQVYQSLQSRDYQDKLPLKNLPQTLLKLR
jgi:hypothetical protein